MFSLLFCCICMSLVATVSNHSIFFANAGLQCRLFLGCLAWKWVLPVWWICSIECWPTAMFCQNLNQPRFAILLQKAIQCFARLFLKPIADPHPNSMISNSGVWQWAQSAPLYIACIIVSSGYWILWSSLFEVFVFIFITDKKEVCYMEDKMSGLVGLNGSR